MSGRMVPLIVFEIVDEGKPMIPIVSFVRSTGSGNRFGGIILALTWSYEHLLDLLSTWSSVFGVLVVMMELSGFGFLSH